MKKPATGGFFHVLAMRHHRARGLTGAEPQLPATFMRLTSTEPTIFAP